ncbi:sugar ABC transporter ATP-binding protein [Litorilinea aerophila]|uniref:Sugar ABC transporter ATP-binding protein n=1 Tax=Litorilinea aerophila TaxID=1204385 RepID=A0A540VLS5_9CHLR|nr:sugar ABC transporter ATP-binding protein [Litorilinea aerophila]MCC9074931.1 sugar ABC transporter ATP-binding protein [Litorilinea aerophila]GIV76917.1 MAG: ribose import ATP-binding protein RbsA [Litorilinea sp.]
MSDSTQPSRPLLRMVEITKTFPGVRALDRVTFEVYPGEVHGLVGENGAGKSTLMKILSGALQPDSGTIELQGRPVSVPTPRAAQLLGIGLIHQELAVLPELSVAENVFLGREPTGRLGLIDWPRLYRQTRELLERMGVDLDPRTRVGDLPIAQQQMVEIAKALSLDAEILVMDEPTSALTERETEILFRLIQGLRSQGVTIIYISHRMEEIFAICDRVTVLRDGQHIASRAIQELTPEEIVRLMVGRSITEMYPPPGQGSGPVRLEVREVRRAPRLRGVTLTLRSGEIVGLAGLVGSGRSDLARAIFGADPIDGGEIRVNGTAVALRGPAEAMALGMGFIPEDRKTQGLFLNMDVRQNTVIARLKELSRLLGFIDFRRARAEAQHFVEELNIRTPNLEQQVRNLSGGNQQKVIIARWMARRPAILILDEPTRGIDVGAKAEIHNLMRRLADQGMAILMISSELPEVLGVSDRILVMREGRIVAEFSREEATQDRVMLYATGSLESMSQEGAVQQ